MNPQLTAATQLALAAAVLAEQHPGRPVFQDVQLVAAEQVQELFAEGQTAALESLLAVFDAAVGRAAYEAGVSRSEMARQIVETVVALDGRGDTTEGEAP